MGLSDKVRQQFARMGHSRLPAAKPKNETDIMPRNWPSLLAFLNCQTQWRAIATMGGLIWQGLDYGAARGALEEMGLPLSYMADIRALEAAALPILNEAR